MCVWLPPCAFKCVTRAVLVFVSLQWSKFLTIGIPFRLAKHLREATTALRVDPSCIPADVAVATYLRQLKRFVARSKSHASGAGSGAGAGAGAGGKAGGGGKGKPLPSDSKDSAAALAEVTDVLRRLAALNVDPLEFARYADVLATEDAAFIILDTLRALGLPLVHRPKQLWPVLWQKQGSDSAKHGRKKADDSDNGGGGFGAGGAIAGLLATASAAGAGFLASAVGLDIDEVMDGVEEKKEQAEALIEKGKALAAKRSGKGGGDTGGAVPSKSSAAQLSTQQVPAVVAGVQALTNMLGFGSAVVASFAKRDKHTVVGAVCTLAAHHHLFGTWSCSAPILSSTFFTNLSCIRRRSGARRRLGQHGATGEHGVLCRRVLFGNVCFVFDLLRVFSRTWCTRNTNACTQRC